MKSIFGLAALAAAMLIGSQVFAYQIQDGGITAPEVAKVLQDKGFKAQVGADDTGDPVIKSASGGVDFTVFFYGCNHTPRCSSITFQAAFHVDGGLTYAKINKWNHDRRFLKGWLDEVNDPFCEMDLDVEHGFLTEGLANNIDTWTAVLPDFQKFISS